MLSQDSVAGSRKAIYGGRAVLKNRAAAESRFVAISFCPWWDCGPADRDPKGSRCRLSAKYAGTWRDGNKLRV